MSRESFPSPNHTLTPPPQVDVLARVLSDVVSDEDVALMIAKGRAAGGAGTKEVGA